MNFSLSLENFEGPLDLLVYLIQKQELEICDILLKKITEKFFERPLDENIEEGAEFLGISSTLLLIKSRKLLPIHSNEEGPIDDDLPKWETFQQLFEYTQFKGIAEKLGQRQDQQSYFFPRGVVEEQKQKPSGLEYLSLDDLSEVLKQILLKRPAFLEKITEERWHVSDKIAYIKEELLIQNKLNLHDLLNPEKCREELIVTFLAILELMKDQKAIIIRKEQEIYILPYATGN